LRAVNDRNYVHAITVDSIDDAVWRLDDLTDGLGAMLRDHAA